MTERKYSKYITTDLDTSRFSPDQNAEYAKWATRVLMLDDNVTEGAMKFSCSWYFGAPDKPLEAHTHDYNELLGFFGCDPENPHDLGGEIEFWLEDEQYFIDKSCLIFIPKGMKHCPLSTRRIDRPFFHFGVVTE